MRLKFPEPVGDRAHDAAGVELPGMILRVLVTEPLPAERSAWHQRTAGAGPAAVMGETATGWPLAIVERARVVYGFYELFDRGVAVAVAAAGDAFDPARARELLQAADLDRTQREVVALAQLWDDGAGPV